MGRLFTVMFQENLSRILGTVLGNLSESKREQSELNFGEEDSEVQNGVGERAEFCVCVCVSVCTCICMNANIHREGQEREREREKRNLYLSFSFFISRSLCLCVVS